MDKTQRNKETVRRIYTEALAPPDDLYKLPLEDYKSAIHDKNTSSPVLKSIDAFYDPDLITHDPAARSSKGTEQLKILLKAYHNALPGHTYTLHEMVAEGDMVAYRWRAQGVHTGTLMGIEATGKAIEVEGFTIARFSDEGRVREIWQQWDRQSLLEQLGVSKMLNKANE